MKKKYGLDLSSWQAAEIMKVLQRFADGSFDTGDARNFLMSVREFARRRQGKPPGKKGSPEYLEYKETYEYKRLSYFLDWADFVAHGSREQGIIYDSVRAKAEAFRLHFMDPIVNPYPSQVEGYPIWIVFHVGLELAYEYLDEFQTPLKSSDKTKILAYQVDIEMMLLAIPQGATIPLKSGGYALLCLRPVRDMVWLSAALFDEIQETLNVKCSRYIFFGTTSYLTPIPQMHIGPFQFVLVDSSIPKDRMNAVVHDSGIPYTYEVSRNEDGSRQYRRADIQGGLAKDSREPLENPQYFMRTKYKELQIAFDKARFKTVTEKYEH